MIISHRHRFIFFNTPGTGSDVIEAALARRCGAEDMVTITGQNCSLPVGRLTALHHLWKIMKTGRPATLSDDYEAEEIRFRFPEAWESYYKFAFCRNPWDKVVALAGDQDPTQFALSFDARTADGISKLLDEEFDDVMLDDVFHYEKMDEALSVLSNRFGFQIEMPAAARSDYASVLSQGAIERIRYVFAKEVAFFGYDSMMRDAVTQPARSVAHG